MSKAAKQSIFILMGLLVISLGYTGYTLMEKQKLQEDKAVVEGELQQSTEREKKQVAENKKLESEKSKLSQDLQQANALTDDLRKQVQDAEAQIKDVSDKLNAEIDELTKDRDNWKSRIDRITKERDDLLVKVQSMPPPAPTTPTPAPTPTRPSLPPPSSGEGGTSAVDEEYWAKIVQDKTNLEIEIDRLNDK